MITLYSNRTPNSQKIAIFFEEIEEPYESVKIDIFKGEHLTREFHSLNPNNKLPVIVDHDPGDNKGPLTIFESGAILLYLAEKFGHLLSSDIRTRTITVQWLCWQISGQGPMHGQAHHFIRYAPERQDYAVSRYVKEAKRLLNVMESHLRNEEYFGIEEYSVADIACFPYVNSIEPIGIDIKEFPSVERWYNTLLQRPAIQRVLAGEESIPENHVKARMDLTEEQWSNMFGDRMYNAARPD